MTSHLPPDPTPIGDPVRLHDLAAVAAVAARLLRLAARTGTGIAIPPAGAKYDALAQAVQDAADAAQYAAALMVEALEPPPAP